MLKNGEVKIAFMEGKNRLFCKDKNNIIEKKDNSAHWLDTHKQYKDMKCSFHCEFQKFSLSMTRPRLFL